MGDGNSIYDPALLLVNRTMDRVDFQRRAGCNVVMLTRSTTTAAER